MAQVPTFQNKSRLKTVREDSLNPAIQKVNALEFNQQTLIRDVSQTKQTLTTMANELRDAENQLATFFQNLSQTFAEAEVDVPEKSIVFRHNSTGVELQRLLLSDLLKSTGVFVVPTDVTRVNGVPAPINVLEFAGPGVTTRIDSIDSTKAVISIPGGGGGGVGGSITATVGSDTAPVTGITVSGNLYGTGIQSDQLIINIPNGRFEGVAKNLEDLKNFSTYSEVDNSFAFLEMTSTDSTGTAKKGYYPHIYTVPTTGSAATWVPFNSVGSLEIKVKNEDGSYTTESFASRIIKSPNIKIVDGHMFIEDQSIKATKVIDGAASELGTIGEIEFEGDFVTDEVIPGSTKKKIKIRSGKLVTGKIGSGQEGIIEKIEVSGNTSGSLLKDRTLALKLPFLKGQVDKDGTTGATSNITKTIVKGNVGLSNITNKDLQIDIPYLKVGKKADTTFKSTHRSYAYNEPFDKWKDKTQWNPLKEGLEVRWHNDEAWDDGTPWGIFEDTSAFDTGVLEFDGNVTLTELDRTNKKTQIKVDYLQGEVSSLPGTPHDVKKIIFPSDTVINQGTATLLVPDGKMKFRIGGNLVDEPVDYIKADTSEITLAQDGNKKYAEFVGFNRFKKNTQNLGRPQSIDSAIDESAFYFIPKQTVPDNLIKYHYQEPFSKWRDKLRWSTLGEDSPSKKLLEIGGWLVNLYNLTGQTESFSQTFYPLDNSTPWFRSGTKEKIPVEKWRPLGALLGEEDKLITRIQAENGAVNNEALVISAAKYQDAEGSAQILKLLKVDNSMSLDGDANSTTLSAKPPRAYIGDDPETAQDVKLLKVDSHLGAIDTDKKTLHLKALKLGNDSFNTVKAGANIDLSVDSTLGSLTIGTTADITTSTVTVGEKSVGLKKVVGKEGDLEITDEGELSFPGFDRFPKDIAPSSGYSIDSPSKVSGVVYINPNTTDDNTLNYSYQEPFSKWRDKLRWNTLDASSPSQELIKKGGWILTLSTKGTSEADDLISQTFYPKDNSEIMSRSGKYSDLKAIKWKSSGAIEARVNNKDPEFVREISVKSGDLSNGTLSILQTEFDTNVGTGDTGPSGFLRVLSPADDSIEFSEKEGTTKGLVEISAKRLQYNNKPVKEIDAGENITFDEIDGKITINSIGGSGTGGVLVKVDEETTSHQAGVVKVDSSMGAVESGVLTLSSPQFNGNPIKEFRAGTGISLTSGTTQGSENILTVSATGTSAAKISVIVSQDGEESPTAQDVNGLIAKSSDVSINQQNLLSFTGFDRLPNSVREVQGFNIDAPGEHTRFVYFTPTASSEDVGEESLLATPSINKSGWVMNLYTDDDHTPGDHALMHQTLYPSDGSAVMTRSGPFNDIAGKQWTVVGGGGATGSATLQEGSGTEEAFQSDHPFGSSTRELWVRKDTSAGPKDYTSELYFGDTGRWSSYGGTFYTDVSGKKDYHWGQDTGKAFKNLSLALPNKVSKDSLYAGSGEDTSLGYFYMDAGDKNNPSEGSSLEDLIVHRIPYKKGEDSKNYHRELLFGTSTDRVWSRKYNPDSGTYETEQIAGVSDGQYAIFTTWPDLTVGDLWDSATTTTNIGTYHPLQSSSYFADCVVRSGNNGSYISVLKSGTYDVTVCLCLSGVAVGVGETITVTIKLVNENGVALNKQKDFVINPDKKGDSAYYYPTQLVRFKDIPFNQKDSVEVLFSFYASPSHVERVKRLDLDPYKNFLLIEPSSTRKYRPGLYTAMTLKNTLGGLSFQAGSEVRVANYGAKTRTFGAQLDPTMNPDVQEV